MIYTYVVLSKIRKVCQGAYVLFSDEVWLGELTQRQSVPAEMTHQHTQTHPTQEAQSKSSVLPAVEKDSALHAGLDWMAR